MNLSDSPFMFFFHGDPRYRGVELPSFHDPVGWDANGSPPDAVGD